MEDLHYSYKDLYYLLYLVLQCCIDFTVLPNEELKCHLCFSLFYCI